ncbi:N-acetyltransferase Eis [Methanimicrococcus sp. At1]|uniref:N-acetyltransferase Eis n=1 Tax=Methanimicrococcus hacksteinii TaxID=3028293 RepID=A0ABU3VRQ2_9EURY|nr:GNAT family N-acetyltransferase [Methanimicrococcus sp. At1]MDV0446082.1 N-acetyltransferase Eis [Methanimicrococcus sp. At1]
MDENKVRSRLELRPVEMGHLDQFNELLRYVFQVTNQEIRRSGYKEGELLRSKRPVLRESEVIGWFDGDKLVSSVSIYPRQANIHGRIYEMAGLTGVGTYPEYANLGLMSDLIKTALIKMRESGQWISYLYPYSIPYYRKKGWEIITEMISYTVKDTQLPKHVDAPGFVERLPVDDSDVISVYDKFSRKNHGAMIRSPIAWEEYWRWENEEERTAAVYYNVLEEPAGLLFYWVADDIFHIKEMVYLNQEARYGLWNFISAHFSMVNEVRGNIYKNEPIAFLLEDSMIPETIEPYYMARIVDVRAFLENYPFDGTTSPFHFIVEDPIAEWNSGIFSVSWDENGKIKISNEPAGKPVQLNIQTLTALLMSYRNPYYFNEIERLETDAETLKVLDRIIPDRRPYFSDYF